MLIQAIHYAFPYYNHICYDGLYKGSPWHMDGCLWHSFDHQRGYHPDPLYDGLMDVFRRPKCSYYAFKAQRPAVVSESLAESGPMAYITHEMTPFPSRDVTVCSNRDEVRLTVNKDGQTYTCKKDETRKGMPSPIITFPGIFDFMVGRKMAREKHGADVYLLAKGLTDSKVVVIHKIMPARCTEQIRLKVNNERIGLRADGSDFVTVVAGITDKSGDVEHLNNYYIEFFVEGKGRISGGAGVLANPTPMRWDSASVLIRSTTTPRKIKVGASVLFRGSQMPVNGELELTSSALMYPLIFGKKEETLPKPSESFSMDEKSGAELKLERRYRKLNELKLKEMEQQQADFGEKID